MSTVVHCISPYLPVKSRIIPNTTLKRIQQTRNFYYKCIEPVFEPVFQKSVLTSAFSKKEFYFESDFGLGVRDF